jgi:hypothetical protein
MTDRPIEIGDTPGVAAPADEDREGSLDLPPDRDEQGPEQQVLDLPGRDDDRGPQRLPRPVPGDDDPDTSFEDPSEVMPLT